MSHRTELVESTGRCSDQGRSWEVKLLHYERTRVVFIQWLLLLSRGGRRGNGDGYLTLEARGRLQTIHCFSHYWRRYGNCSTHRHGKKKKERKLVKKAKVHWLSKKSWMIKRKHCHPGRIITKEQGRGVLTIYTAKNHTLQPTFNNNNDHRGIYWFKQSNLIWLVCRLREAVLSQTTSKWLRCIPAHSI